MEKSSLKDDNGRSSTNPYFSWGKSISDEADNLIGDLVSWPPRCYTCTFCKREFRSAQALGGHMNVHRRDRARLRQIPSSFNYTFLNPNPNPNLSPYFSSSPSSTQHNSPFVLPSTTYPSYRLCPKGRANLTMMKSQIPAFGVCKFDGFPSKNKGKIVKKSEIVRLNLEIGLFGESKSDDLDLELRLGCP